MKRSTMLSSTSAGAMPLAEQNRIKDDSLQRTNRSLIWARSASHAGVRGAPCLGMRFSRASHSRALFTLLLWFCSVLRVKPSGQMVQPGEVGSNGAESRRDHLQRLVQRLGDLPQGRRPVALGLFRKLVRRRDDRDGVGEGGSRSRLGLAHWDQHRDAWDGWGLTQVYSRVFWEYVNVILTISTSADVPNLRSTSFLLDVY